MATENLWTGFNNRKLAAERAKKDWNGRLLTSIASANDATITIKVANASTGPTAGSFTTNQDTPDTITIPAAVSAPNGGSATPGVMSAGDKEKLDSLEVYTVTDSTTNGNILVNGVDEIDVYTHPTDGPSGTTDQNPLSAGDTTNQTPAFGGTFKVTSETVDFRGHTTALAEHTVTIPDATAIASVSGAGGSAGLMSAADKEKLDGVETGAQANVKPDWNATAGTAAEILNKPSIPSAANDAALNLVLGTAQSTQVFSADASSAGTITIPMASAVTSGSTTTYTEGLMSGQDKERLGEISDVIPSTASPSNKLVDQTALSTALADFGGFKVSTGTGADMHPDENNPSTKIIYLVYDSSATGDDKYKEWIWDAGDSQANPPVSAHWELIGDTTMRVSGYAQIPSGAVDTHIVLFGTGTSLVDSNTTISQLENKVTTVSVAGGTPINPTANTTNIDLPVATNSSGTGTAGVMSGADKVKLDGIATGAEVNVVETVSVNGGTPVQAVNKNIDLTISLPSASSATPQMDGTGAAGSSTDYARADHEHPSDTSKADKITPATAGNFASLDSNGNLADSTVSASSFKTVQTAVSDPSASGNATSFIDTISQNTNGVISVTKKTVPTVSKSTSAVGGTDGLMTAQQAEALYDLNTWTYDTFGDNGPSGTDTPVVFPVAQSGT